MNVSALTARRVRHRESPAISLFPFLAVLICTMGALVPLLLAMARQARLQAIQEATAKATQRSAEAQSQRELIEWRIGELKTARQQAEEQLAQARLALGHVENHARRLRQEGDRLQATIADLKHSHTHGELNRDEDQLHRDEREENWEKLDHEIKDAERQLAAAQQAAAAKPPSYAIIPYQGPHGTHRPPIYIECRADAIVLQPEGIALTESDFQEPIEANNPLDQALRAARETLLAQKQIRGDGSDEPYPLLLVRPDGIPAYYVARAALQSWKSALGYELVGKDWELEFPSPNPEVERAMRAAVADAREQRRQRNLLGAMLANTQSTGLFRAPAAMPPFPSTHHGHGYSSVSGNGNTIANSSAGSTNTSGNGGNGNEIPVLAPPGSASGRATVASDLGPAADGIANPAVFGAARSAPRESRVTYRAAPGGGLIRELEPETSSAAAAAMSRRGFASASRMNANRDANANAAASAETTSRRHPASPPPETTNSAKTAAMRSGEATRPGEWIPQETKPPAERQDRDETSPPRDAKTKCLADSRGENWGLPNAARGSVGVTRPIRVRCTSNRLEIIPDGESGVRKFVPLGERIEDTIDDFVSAVWEYMKTWGIAGRGMYWRPILHVEVTPDAEFRFEELKMLLDNSGLMIERKS